jgi:hypothetical protein
LGARKPQTQRDIFSQAWLKLPIPSILYNKVVM